MHKMKIKLRYKIIFNVIIYVLGVVTAVSIPIIKWSVISPFFGRKVDVNKSIDGLALKEGIVLKESSKFVTQPVEAKNTKKMLFPIIISQEYPSSQGFNYQQSINLSNKPAVMTYQDDWQPFWLGIGNANEEIENFKNPNLFLNFHGKIQIKITEASKGWTEMDPNFTYYLKTQGSIQPGQGYRLYPLYVKFPTKGLFVVSYTVTSDNALPVSGEFTIKVTK